MSEALHPDHDDLVELVRSWFHLPFEGMGYRAVRRRWGTYWNNGQVHTPGFPPGEANQFVDDLREYYDQRPVYVNVDDPAVDARLGPALVAAGCVQGKADMFLAHTGPVPAPPDVDGLVVEPVDEANLRQFALTRLRAFATKGEEPCDAELDEEARCRGEELAGTGRGMLARVHGEPVGVIWWYEEPDDAWILYLAVRAQFRRRGIGTWLLCRRLAHAYGHGRRSVMINVETGNSGAIRLYQRLGFRDRVYWRQRYVLHS